MAKVEITEELLKRMNQKLQSQKGIVVNDGLSRKELRALEKRGYLSKKPMMRKDTGARMILYKKNPIIGISR